VALSNQKEDITVDEELNAWLQKEYHVGETTAPGYIRVIKYLGAIDIDSMGRITITSFGDEIVNAEVYLTGENPVQLSQVEMEDSTLF
jgi:hypothetical protein